MPSPAKTSTGVVPTTKCGTCSDRPRYPSRVELGGLQIEHSHGRLITVANMGPRRDDKTAARVRALPGCGYAAESSEPDDDPDDEEAEPTGHRPFCPARKDPKVTW